jgi:hypothetical protein
MYVRVLTICIIYRIVYARTIFYSSARRATLFSFFLYSTMKDYSEHK